MLNVALARARREELGLTQDELAKRLGIQQASLSRLESGEREPRIAFLRRWARELGVEPSALIADSDAESAGDGQPEPAGKAAGQ